MVRPWNSSCFFFKSVSKLVFSKLLLVLSISDSTVTAQGERGEPGLLGEPGPPGPKVSYRNSVVVSGS